MGQRHGSDSTHLGAKLGPKLAALLADTSADHLRKSSGVWSSIIADGAVKFFRTVTDERDTHAQELLDLWRLHPGKHDGLQKLLEFTHHGSGELSALLSEHMLAGSVATGIGSGLANLLAPANQAIMFNDPAQVLQPGEMAQLAAARIVSDGYAIHVAKMSGLPQEATEDLIEASRSYPSIGILLELLNRKLIGGDEAVLALRRAGVPEQYIGPLMQSRFQIESPEDLALQVLKGIRSEAEVLPEAEFGGYTRERLQNLIAMTGEPPGPQELAEAYRRGMIDEQRFVHGIRQSRIRNEWTDVLLKLRFTPASPADALRGVVQGHLTAAEGKHIAELGGLRPDDWDWLQKTEGNPPGMMTMIELWRRGRASQQQVEEAIREGRTKNKYIPSLVHLKRRLPPERSVATMVARGTMTEQHAAEILAKYGYEHDEITSILHSATTAQASREKTLARAEVQELYYEHSIGESEALKLLRVLGYSDATAKLVLSLVDLKRERALRQAAMGPIRSAFIARHIGEQEASNQLDGLGVAHKERDFALTMWKHDRETHVKLLTEAQIVKAAKKDLLTEPEAVGRLTAQGYSTGDAHILLQL